MMPTNMPTTLTPTTATPTMKPTADPCDLVTVHSPLATASGGLDLEIHTGKYDYYTNIDTITIDVGTDKFVFDKNDSALTSFKLNGAPQTRAGTNQASHYGTHLDTSEAISIRHDDCTTVSPCHTQELEQVARGEFRVVIQPCE